MKRTRLADRILPIYTKREESINMTKRAIYLEHSLIVGCQRTQQTQDMCLGIMKSHDRTRLTVIHRRTTSARSIHTNIF